MSIKNNLNAPPSEYLVNERNDFVPTAHDCLYCQSIATLLCLALLEKSVPGGMWKCLQNPEICLFRMYHKTCFVSAKIKFYLWLLGVIPKSWVTKLTALCFQTEAFKQLPALHCLRALQITITIIIYSCFSQYWLHKEENQRAIKT